MNFRSELLKWFQYYIVYSHKYKLTYVYVHVAFESSAGNFGSTFMYTSK